MKIFFNKTALRIMKPLLLTGFCLAVVSSLSHARPLKVGDEYGGGVIIYLFPQGDEGFKERTEEVMIAGKTNISEHLFWSDTKAASDTFFGPSYRDWKARGGFSTKSVIGIYAIESDDQNSLR